MHWKNHRDCCAAQDMDSHVELRQFNSQVVEQRHALLKKLKSMLSYMDYEHFLLFLKYFHAMQNAFKLGHAAPENKAQFGDLKEMFHRR